MELSQRDQVKIHGVEANQAFGDRYRNVSYGIFSAFLFHRSYSTIQIYDGKRKIAEIDSRYFSKFEDFKEYIQNFLSSL